MGRPGWKKDGSRKKLSKLIWGWLVATDAFNAVGKQIEQSLVRFAAKLFPSLRNRPIDDAALLFAGVDFPCACNRRTIGDCGPAQELGEMLRGNVRFLPLDINSEELPLVPTALQER
jgi:hypothetical protein